MRSAPAARGQERQRRHPELPLLTKRMLQRSLRRSALAASISVIRPTQGIEALTEAVGQNMFGRGIQFAALPRPKLPGFHLLPHQPVQQPIATPGAAGTASRWSCFDTADRAGGAELWRASQQLNPNTVTVTLFSDKTGCTTAWETLKMGQINECHKSNAQFQRALPTLGPGSLRPRVSHRGLYRCQLPERGLHV